MTASKMTLDAQTFFVMRCQRCFFSPQVIKRLTEFPKSDRLDEVANTVVTALTSHAPRARDRYPVGLDARMLMAMVSWLPTFAMDFILLSWLKAPLPRIGRKS